MYNGIGLPTPRGSGTNGYIQRNLSALPPKREKINYQTEADIARMEKAMERKPNKEILEHEWKRKIELKCLELREELEDQGHSETEIGRQVECLRGSLLSKGYNSADVDPSANDSHHLAEAAQKKREQLREAFKISADYVDGSAFDITQQALRAEKRKAERARASGAQNRSKEGAETGDQTGDQTGEDGSNGDTAKKGAEAVSKEPQSEESSSEEEGLAVKKHRSAVEPSDVQSVPSIKTSTDKTAKRKTSLTPASESSSLSPSPTSDLKLRKGRMNVAGPKQPQSNDDGHAGKEMSPSPVDDQSESLRNQQSDKRPGREKKPPERRIGHSGTSEQKARTSPSSEQRPQKEADLPVRNQSQRFQERRGLSPDREERLALPQDRARVESSQDVQRRSSSPQQKKGRPTPEQRQRSRSPGRRRRRSSSPTRRQRSRSRERGRKRRSRSPAKRWSPVRRRSRSPGRWRSPERRRLRSPRRLSRSRRSYSPERRSPEKHPRSPKRRHKDRSSTESSSASSVNEAQDGGSPSSRKSSTKQDGSESERSGSAK